MVIQSYYNGPLQNFEMLLKQGILLFYAILHPAVIHIMYSAVSLWFYHSQCLLKIVDLWLPK